MDVGPTLIPLNFEIDLDHYLDTKKYHPNFPIHLLFTCLGGGLCFPSALAVLFFHVCPAGVKFTFSDKLLIP